MQTSLVADDCDKAESSTSFEHYIARLVFFLQHKSHLVLTLLAIESNECEWLNYECAVSGGIDLCSRATFSDGVTKEKPSICAGRKPY